MQQDITANGERRKPSGSVLVPRAGSRTDGDTVLQVSVYTVVHECNTTTYKTTFSIFTTCTAYSRSPR